MPKLNEFSGYFKWHLIHRDGSPAGKPFVCRAVRRLVGSPMVLLDLPKCATFIDNDGNPIKTYRNAAPFEGPFAEVKDDDGWHLVDRRFRPQSPLRFENCYSSGVVGLWIVVNNDQYSLVYPDGTPVWGSRTFSEFGRFSEGLAAFQANDRYGYVEIDGSIACEAKWGHAEAFSCGRAVVVLPDPSDPLAATRIVKRDFTIVSCKYFAVGNFSEGLANVNRVDGKVLWIDVNGKAAIEPKYDDGGSFYKGRALAKVGNRWMLIDRRGHVVCSAPKRRYGYADVALDGEGPFPVMENKLWGYCDGDGELVIPCKYLAVRDFIGDLGLVATEVASGTTALVRL